MPNRQAHSADAAGVGQLDRKTGMAAHLDGLATGAREACADQSRDLLGCRDLQTSGGAELACPRRIAEERHVHRLLVFGDTVPRDRLGPDEDSVVINGARALELAADQVTLGQAVSAGTPVEGFARLGLVADRDQKGFIAFAERGPGSIDHQRGSADGVFGDGEAKRFARGLLEIVRIAAGPGSDVQPLVCLCVGVGDDVDLDGHRFLPRGEFGAQSGFENSVVQQDVMEEILVIAILTGPIEILMASEIDQHRGGL